MIIGYTTGVFDMFNIGHLNILRRAKEQCDYLIVGVSTDELVQHEKNKTPIIRFNDRCAIVKAIKYVDKVVAQPDKNKMRAWEREHFNKMFVGSDWKGTEAWKVFERQFEPLGVEIVYLDHTDGISSALLREKIIVTKKIDKPVVVTDIGKVDASTGSVVDEGDKQLINNIVGYTTGVYDMFHIGHLNILRRARQQCDYLVVGVSTDECVQSYKNKKPIIPFEERAEIVSAIKYVDQVIPQRNMDKLDFLKRNHFDVMFHGDEWKGTDLYKKYENEFSKYGARIEYLSHTDGISSSILRSKITK